MNEAPVGEANITTCPHEMIAHSMTGGRVDDLALIPFGQQSCHIGGVITLCLSASCWASSHQTLSQRQNDLSRRANFNSADLTFDQ